jgi:uncharacterized protein (DUF1778 family)
MTLRLDQEDSALLKALSEAQGVSMHEAALRAIRQMAREAGHSVRVTQASDEMFERWSDVLDRLGEA